MFIHHKLHILLQFLFKSIKVYILISGAKSAVRKEGREEEMKRHREKAEELARQALQANEEYKQSLQRFERSKAGEESEEREDSQLDVEKGTADLRVNCKAPIGKLKEGKEEG